MAAKENTDQGDDQNPQYRDLSFHSSFKFDPRDKVLGEHF